MRTRLIESALGVPPAEVLFVSSNPWDACGAKAFGLNVAWIERVTPEAMVLACAKSEMVAPLTMFKAIRTQMDELGLEARPSHPHAVGTARSGRAHESSEYRYARSSPKRPPISP